MMVGAGSQAQVPPPPGYSAAQVRPYCGATARFEWPCIQVKAICGVPEDDRSASWDATLRFLDRLAGRHPALEGWRHELASVDPAQAGEEPLAAVLQALLASRGVPDYPLNWHRADDGELTLYLACPYQKPLRLCLDMGFALLRWGHRRLLGHSLSLEVGQFAAAYDRLPELLPPAAVMAFHKRLWQRGIGWRWLGGARTIVGQGAAQRIVEGAGANLPLDPADDLRVPIYTVTGSVGKTTTSRLLAQLLQGSGRRLALAASDGAWVGERQLVEGDAIGGRIARSLLQDKEVEAAIFEQGRGGIIMQGVPYAHSDVAVLLNVQAHHLGVDGIETIEQMADVKALGLRPARIAVFNADDEQCCRIGAARAAGSCVWFSLEAKGDELGALAKGSAGALGIERSARGDPQAILIIEQGRPQTRLSLTGVAPYHGFLGEKTLEELLAAVAAAWFGPIPLSGWEEALRGLRLDGENHIFRTSVHRSGNVLIVLDKAGYAPAIQTLRGGIEEICAKEGIKHRIAVLSRSAAMPLDDQFKSSRVVYPFIDEFICFDRPEAYQHPLALPIYQPGSLPLIMRKDLLRLNQDFGLAKPVHLLADWTATEAYLDRLLARTTRKTLLLINQPATSAPELDKRIIDYVKARAG